MKDIYLGFISILLFPLLLAGCGGGSGAPGSSGSADTGVLVQSVGAVVSTPTSSGGTAGGGGTSNPDIDTAIHLCPGGEPEAGLFRTDAILTVSTAALNPDTASDPFPASVERCTITYKKADEDPAAPIIPEFTAYPNCPLIDGENTCIMTFMDIQRKVDFWDALVGATNYPATYPTHYIGVINCSYMNAFGKSGNFQTEVDVWLADFDLC
ncbi:MAG: hypothetical protein P8013_01590 [Candidatus Sulfobium sp.]|jgi:hypothetical protein